MKLIRAIVFDLDGTITEPFFDFDAIRAEMGLAKDAGPILEAIDKMEPQSRKRAEQILAYHERKAVIESKLNPGAEQTLNSLRQKGIKIGILTRNTLSNTMAVARKHGLEFDAVVSREDGPVKPDAFGITKLCGVFGVSPAETLVVGDYLFDLLCAKAAGAVAVLLVNHEKANEFIEYADFTIEKLEQILDIIENHK
jgi:HAD superfamily hydrolase (TIGR01509 family)